jgi:beta-glucosidase
MSQRMSIRPLLVILTFVACAAIQAQNAVQLAPPVIQQTQAGIVTLKAAPDTTILYTLDGAEPIAKSNPYLAPIDIPHGGTLKARTFSQDRKTMSEVITKVLPPIPSFVVPIPSTLVPVTQDRSWPQYDWAKRHELTSAAVKLAKPQILFIGDSITHFFGGEQFDSYALRGKNTWDEFYAPRNAGNLGFGWDKTENVLWRLQHGAIDGISPKLVVMMIGTNNSGNCSAPDIAAGVEAIVLELEKRLPRSKILLLGIFPRGEKPNAQREKIAAINESIAKLDGTHNVTFLDIGAKFLTPDGLITKDIMPDFLHPNEKGYRIWAEAIESTVKKLMGE